MRRLITWLLVAAILSLGAAGVYRAATPEPPQSPSEVAADVAGSLRCPTCQGLSVADSPSSMAEGMRAIIAEQAAAGRSPEEIRGYFVQRYGEWILLSPPIRGLTVLLWLFPGLLVLGGVILAVYAARRRGRQVSTTESDLTRAIETYDAYRTGDYPPADSPPTERVEAALQLLHSVDTDNPDGSHKAARTDALHALAAALTNPDPSEDPAPARSTSDPVESKAKPAAHRPRRLAYGAGLLGFATILALLLVGNISDRGNNGLITGEPAPQPSSQATPANNLENLRRLTQEHPGDATAWIALGLAHDSRGELAKAYDAYQRATDLAPNNATARKLTAWTLIRGGSPDEAIGVIRPVLDRNPTDPRATLLLGLAQHETDHPAADDTLRRYLRLDPSSQAADRVRNLLEDS